MRNPQGVRKEKAKNSSSKKIRQKSFKTLSALGDLKKACERICGKRLRFLLSSTPLPPIAFLNRHTKCPGFFLFIHSMVQ